MEAPLVTRQRPGIPLILCLIVRLEQNATIICGITTGQYTLIGAGAVITKDFKPFALVVRNPARQIGWISINFDNNGEASRPEGGEKYTLKNDEVEVT